MLVVIILLREAQSIIMPFFIHFTLPVANISLRRFLALNTCSFHTMQILALKLLAHSRKKISGLISSPSFRNISEKM